MSRSRAVVYGVVAGLVTVLLVVAVLRGTEYDFLAIVGGALAGCVVAVVVPTWLSRRPPDEPARG